MLTWHRMFFNGFCHNGLGNVMHLPLGGALYCLERYCIIFVQTLKCVVNKFLAKISSYKIGGVWVIMLHTSHIEI